MAGEKRHVCALVGLFTFPRRAKSGEFAIGEFAIVRCFVVVFTDCGPVRRGCVILYLANIESAWMPVGRHRR